MDREKKRKYVKNIIVYSLMAILGGALIFSIVKELRSREGEPETIPDSDMDADMNIMQSLEEMEDVYYPKGIYVALEYDQRHSVYMFQREKQCWFLLPTYAKEADIYLFYDEEQYGISLDGRSIKSGEKLSNIIWDKPGMFLVEKEGVQYEYEIVFKHSENLPAVFVNTKSGSMDYIYDSIENAEPGEVAIVLQDGVEDYSGALERIKGRGNYSWSRSKKSFTMTLEDSSDLLNMGNAYKWILLANVDDGSYMRNKITFDMARQLGIDYVTDAEFIDLYLNGEYAGNYYMCEKIEVASGRIQLQDGNRQNYLIELDNYLGESSTFISASGVKVSIHYPEDATETQNEEISRLFQSIENAVLAEDGVDPVTGKYYTELIDVDGLIKRYLIDELGKLDDGWDGSSYFFTRNDGKLYAGPVWDYELSLGNVPPWFAGDENPQGFREIKISNWYAALYEKEDFFQRMVDIYNFQMVPILDEILEKRIDEYAEEIYASAQMDRIVWEGKNFYLPYKDLDGQVNALKSFLCKRMAFFDETWNQGYIYHEVQLQSEGSGIVGYYYVKDGECLTALPDVAKEGSIFAGWFYSNGQKYSPFYPIFEDITIIAKWDEEEPE